MKKYYLSVLVIMDLRYKFKRETEFRWQTWQLCHHISPTAIVFFTRGFWSVYETGGKTKYKHNSKLCSSLAKPESFCSCGGGMISPHSPSCWSLLCIRRYTKVGVRQLHSLHMLCFHKCFSGKELIFLCILDPPVGQIEKAVRFVELSF